MDGVMQNDSVNAEFNDSDKLSSRGASIYYLGSAVFAAGIVLIILGSSLVMFYQLHYGSEAMQIFHTILSISIGIILLLVGINLMIRQTKKDYAIIIASIFFSSLAIYLFYTNYLNNFYYPLVSYIYGLYVLGFLLLLGNAFASVIVWIIGNKSVYQTTLKEKSHLYTDEEIQRDIEEATQKSIESAVNELQFELEELPKDIIVGKTVPKSAGVEIRVKDDMHEVLSLSHALGPAATEKFGSFGIEKASLQLAKTISKENQKKGFFKRFKQKNH
ncbi:MAG: hypothetical protein R6V50_05375 [Thermoplasmatota archaeon]